VPVIISPAEDKQNPDCGVTTAKKALTQFLGKDSDANVRESDFYVFAKLRPKQIEDLATRPEVWQIWLDHETKAHLLNSVETIKASACWRTFEARGDGITWAVLDSGIKSDHPHFQQFQTIDTTLSKNFSGSTSLEDKYGHGTHVAGIIAGCCGPDPQRKFKVATYFDDPDVPKIDEMPAPASGVAPKAKLVNVKVLNDDGSGSRDLHIGREPRHVRRRRAVLYHHRYAGPARQLLLPAQR